MPKYRLVRKGDKYSAQRKVGLVWRYGSFVGYGLALYNPETIKWTTKQRACNLIEAWKEEDEFKKEQKKFNRSPEIVCGPEDQCKGE